jgi:hypothetical protein
MTATDASPVQRVDFAPLEQWRIVNAAAIKADRSGVLSKLPRSRRIVVGAREPR